MRSRFNSQAMGLTFYEQNRNFRLPADQLAKEAGWVARPEPSKRVFLDCGLNRRFGFDRTKAATDAALQKAAPFAKPQGVPPNNPPFQSSRSTSVFRPIAIEDCTKFKRGKERRGTRSMPAMERAYYGAAHV